MEEEEQKNVERLSSLLRSRSPTTIFFESFFIILIDLTALVGNVLVCFVFYKKPMLRTITNVYIGALAISDVLISVLVMPCTAMIFIKGEWIFTDVVCQYQGFVVLLLAWASLHIMTLTAINRYYRVVRPNVYTKWFSIKSSIVMICSTLVIIIIVIVIPIAGAWSHFTFRPGKGTCFMTFNKSFKTTRMVYIAGVVLFYSVLPMIIIFICYYKVLKTVKNHTTVIHPSFKNPLQKREQARATSMSVREVNVTRTLFCMVVGFVVCWIPVIIVEMLNSFLGTASLPRGAYLCYLYFAYISSALNPIIYGVMNKTFRRELFSVLLLRKTEVCLS
ncbi:5-hydroxytryptamine receptor 4-like isoform X2 [Actinia tenebrosa]|nr:5-hydroxytryptamine receptor 4-like isoform X2 [Actinia tenebrosa]XP_031556401.1 5-hydroxytryptamine receptor 4-like isoform X2 [Actinia tenebrosa]